MGLSNLFRSNKSSTSKNQQQLKPSFQPEIASSTTTQSPNSPASSNESAFYSFSKTPIIPNDDSATYTSIDSSSPTSSSFNNSDNYKRLISSATNQFIKSKSTKIPDELQPIITLLNCQDSRVYISGQVNLTNEQTGELNVVDAAVKGNQLLFFGEEATSSKPLINIDILSCSFRLLPELNAFVLNEKYQVSLIDQETLQHWVAAVKLSNYEFTKLSEAYTASLLSLKGIELSDIHVVLAENKFTYQEDCSIKFPADSKWIECRVIIKPRKNSKTNGSIEFYARTNNKATGMKKNSLICKVDSLNSAHAIFPHVDLIDSTSVVKIHGDFSIYKIEEETLSTAVKNTSISGTRSRSSSTTSQFVQSTQQTPKSHRRMSSISSVLSTSSNTSSSSSKEPTYTLQTSSLYIFPKAHRAVPNPETLIRLLIPIYDSFGLYGRPSKLNSDKKHPESLLFALPSLPRVSILNIDHAKMALKEVWEDVSTIEQYNYHDLFNEAVLEMISLDSKYCGFGELKNELNQNFNSISRTGINRYRSNSDFLTNSSGNEDLSDEVFNTGIQGIMYPSVITVANP